MIKFTNKEGQKVMEMDDRGDLKILDEKVKESFDSNEKNEENKEDK